MVWVGSGAKRQLLRLVQVQYHGNWYRYLTNKLNIERLPTAYVVALYWQRWRIEDAYAIVKRLLGLAYFWTGSENMVYHSLYFFAPAAKRGEAADLIADLAAHAKSLGLLKRKRRPPSLDEFFDLTKRKKA